MCNCTSRKRRKLAELSGGTLDLREFRRPADVEPFMHDAVALSRLTYQTRLLDAGLPEGPQAVAGMHALAQRDEIRAYVLYVEQRPVSYLYLPTANGVITYAYLGYDPEFARHSVGTVLQMDVLERLFAEQRYRLFDFTEGHSAHKEMFGTASVNACSFFLLRPSLANLALMAASTCSTRASAWPSNSPPAAAPSPGCASTCAADREGAAAQAVRRGPAGLPDQLDLCRQPDHAARCRSGCGHPPGRTRSARHDCGQPHRQGRQQPVLRPRRHGRACAAA